METFDIAERTAEGIRYGGLRPDQAAFAACKAAGKTATANWLRDCGHRVSGHWTLARLTAGVLNCLLARTNAWEAIEVGQTRTGDFIATDEDALIAITGRDRDGEVPDLEPLGPGDISWASVVEDGLRVDEQCVGGGTAELTERRGAYYRMESLPLHGATILRLRAVGEHDL